VPKVDKILGPGNLIVVLAKKHVFGDVDIDQLPGPTEVLIIADDTPDPEMVAADLLSQAEHDVLASAILLTTSRQMAEAVAAELDKQLPLLPRAPIAGGSLERNGGIVLVRDIAEAIELANEYAPEHLCLLIRDAWQWVGQVRNAGAVFVGESAPEVIGDYVAGPSHILPTGGTARFFSPVHVEDFVKVISVIGIGPRDFERIGPAAMTFAEAEGLQAHASAVRRRLAKRGIMQGYQQAGATEPAGGAS
jgi:histidinol dehydrogenase